LSISERRACAALGQHRSTQRKVPRGREDEEKLTDNLVALAREHGRLGYRKIAAMLRNTLGWVVKDKRVERIWRQGHLRLESRTVVLAWSSANCHLLASCHRTRH
jgi:hypothetical protein